MGERMLSANSVAFASADGRKIFFEVNRPKTAEYIIGVLNAQLDSGVAWRLLMSMPIFDEFLDSAVEI